MADAPNPDLSIRSSARPVKSFSKKAIFISLGGAGLLVLASIGLASSGENASNAGAPEELYSTTHKPTAEGLSTLPVSYSDMEEIKTTPELGPPCPETLAALSFGRKMKGVYLKQTRSQMQLSQTLIWQHKKPPAQQP